jgi:lipoyl-dependent peroxiredoxin
MPEPTYTTHARVVGGRDGHGRTDDGRLDVDLRFPKELGGDGQGTNPEQLFAVGYAACFESVLRLLGPAQQLKVRDASIDSTVTLTRSDDGLFTLGVTLDVSLPSVDDQDRAVALVRDAHERCPYSRATRGNIDVTLTVNGVSV